MTKQTKTPRIAAFFGLLALVFVVAAALPSGATATSLDPRTLLDRVDDLYRGKSSHGRLAMTVTTRNWSRRLDIDFWSEGKVKSLIRILAPKKEKGTTTLRVDENIWNFLPKVNRVIKLPSSMMGGSWMGSHFTNNDLVKESRLSDDYACRVCI